MTPELSSILLKHAADGRTFRPPVTAMSNARSTNLIYRQRNLIERFFNKLKHFRRVATRYDKTARNFLAAVLLAATSLWTRFESTT